MTKFLKTIVKSHITTLYSRMNVYECVCILVIVICDYIFVTHIYFNPSPSMTKGYYFIDSFGGYHVGDNVLICVNKQPYVDVLHHIGLPQDNHACLHHMPYLLKKIVAISGDVITIGHHGIRVNNHLLASGGAITNYHSVFLHPMKQGSYRLESGQFFVLGESPHSYDSRYFGILDESQIVAHAHLVWHRKLPIW